MHRIMFAAMVVIGWMISAEESPAAEGGWAGILDLLGSRSG